MIYYAARTKEDQAAIDWTTVIVGSMTYAEEASVLMSVGGPTIRSRELRAAFAERAANSLPVCACDGNGLLKKWGLPGFIKCACAAQKGVRI